MITIRKAVYSDLPVVSKLHIASWRFAYKGIMQAAFLKQLRLDDRISAWHKVLEHSQGELLVAENNNKGKSNKEGNNKIVGFSHIIASRDDDLNATKFGEITAIYLNPEYIGRGIGYKLLQESICYLTTKGFSHVFLWVLKNNVLAKNFYVQFGFTADGKEKTHSADGLVEERYIFDFTAD